MAEDCSISRTHPERSHEGYHPVKHGPFSGSFEIFHMDAEEAHAEAEDPDSKLQGEGWFWWSCFPGCLPDGEPSGPFATSKEAYDDAMGGE